MTILSDPKAAATWKRVSSSLERESPRESPWTLMFIELVPLGVLYKGGLRSGPGRGRPTPLLWFIKYSISALHVQYVIQVFSRFKRPESTRFHLRELQSQKLFSRRSMHPNLPRKAPLAVLMGAIAPIMPLYTISLGPLYHKILRPPLYNSLLWLTRMFFLRSEEPTYFWLQGYILSRVLIKAAEWLWRLLIRVTKTMWIDLAGQTELEVDSIDHLLVSKTLSFKTRLCRNLSCENEYKSQENKKAFFTNGFALCLVLKQRLGETRNWPISFRSARYLWSWFRQKYFGPISCPWVSEDEFKEVFLFQPSPTTERRSFL